METSKIVNLMRTADRARDAANAYIAREYRTETAEELERKLAEALGALARATDAVDTMLDDARAAGWK